MNSPRQTNRTNDVREEITERTVTRRDQITPATAPRGTATAAPILDPDVMDNCLLFNNFQKASP